MDNEEGNNESWCEELHNAWCHVFSLCFYFEMQAFM